MFKDKNRWIPVSCHFKINAPDKKNTCAKFNVICMMQVMLLCYVGTLHQHVDEHQLSTIRNIWKDFT